jgi:hypothetical protein
MDSLFVYFTCCSLEDTGLGAERGGQYRGRTKQNWCDTIGYFLVFADYENFFCMYRWDSFSLILRTGPTD